MTRTATSECVRRDPYRLELVDTAGQRAPSRVRDPLEYLSVHSGLGCACFVDVALPVAFVYVCVCVCVLTIADVAPDFLMSSGDATRTCCCTCNDLGLPCLVCVSAAWGYDAALSTVLMLRLS